MGLFFKNKEFTGLKIEKKMLVGTVSLSEASDHGFYIPSKK